MVLGVVINVCISPDVINIETREINWREDHSLNKWKQAYQELFDDEKGEGMISKIPQAVVLPPDIMEPDGDGTWDDFRRKVRKNCGGYLKEHGALNMRETMELDVATDVARRTREKVRCLKNLDRFFEQLKVPIELMKRG